MYAVQQQPADAASSMFGRHTDHVEMNVGDIQDHCLPGSAQGLVSRSRFGPEFRPYVLAKQAELDGTRRTIRARYERHPDDI
jgi:hypothetical protein